MLLHNELFSKMFIPHHCASYDKKTFETHPLCILRQKHLLRKAVFNFAVLKLTSFSQFSNVTH